MTDKMEKKTKVRDKKGHEKDDDKRKEAERKRTKEI